MLNRLVSVQRVKLMVLVAHLRRHRIRSIVSRSMLRSPRYRYRGLQNGFRRRSIWVVGKRSSLYFAPNTTTHALLCRCVLFVRHTLPSRSLRLRSRVVVRNFHSDLASIFALAVQALPHITLTTSRYNNVIQADPRLAHQVRPLVFAEDGYLQVVVV